MAVNTIGKCISTDIYMFPGKLFKDKFIRVWPTGFPWRVGEQIRMANRIDTCHGSTVFYVPVRSPANTVQLFKGNRSLPVSCEALDVFYKIGSTYILPLLNVYIFRNLWVSRFTVQWEIFFLKKVSVLSGFGLEVNQKNHTFFDILAIINLCFFTPVIPSTLQGCW